MLAGMHIAAGPRLAAAVANAGGFGVIGGLGYTPDDLRQQIKELKGYLNDKDTPFGVDLLLPQIGGNARKTNHDYTKGRLDELTDIIIESGAKLFVSAVGVPPKAIVDKLHKHGLLYMNMIGHPKHVQKCIDLGVDMLCAQGSEGGGHTGDIPTGVLIPTIAAMCRGKKSPSGQDVQVIAAGGLFNGQGVASALMLGANAVWIGTRFVLSDESCASKEHQEAIRTAGFDDNVRTIIFTVRKSGKRGYNLLDSTLTLWQGRPLRVRNNSYIQDWEENRQAEIKQLCDSGKIPVDYELENLGDKVPEDVKKHATPLLMGKACGAINERKPAKDIVDEMVNDAVAWLQQGNSYLLKN
ncbi:hypothetical protein OEA41_008588 [Lepraria neglecta]|uniref:2-nitropropane dioxygenase n=1 Tax=Lepraria neglecta TaxID=209136 RepID=A0AAD9Z097_9LECA|nr:hypothetical protein OEA41_008588 [Lepraria neglecta]